MKRYTELDTAELVALTPEQIETLIDLEIAERGIKPVTMPSKPLCIDAGIKPTEDYWQIGHSYYDSFLVKSEADMKAIQSIPVFRTEYGKAGDKYKWIIPTELTIKKALFYKEEDIAKVSTVLQKNQIATERYETDKKLYTKYSEAIADIRQAIMETVDNAKARYRTISDAQANFAKYLTLADGNTEIAKRFFRNAYKDDKDIISAILGSNTEEVKE
jgi:hypothetical protein